MNRIDMPSAASGADNPVGQDAKARNLVAGASEFAAHLEQAQKDAAEPDAGEDPAEGEDASLATDTPFAALVGVEPSETAEPTDEAPDFDRVLAEIEAAASAAPSVEVTAPARALIAAAATASAPTVVTLRQLSPSVDPEPAETPSAENTAEAPATVPTLGTSSSDQAPASTMRSPAAATVARAAVVPDEVAEEWASRAAHNRARVFIGEGDSRVSVFVALEKEGVRVVAEATAAETAELLTRRARELERGLERHGHRLASLSASSPNSADAPEQPTKTARPPRRTIA